MSTGLTLSAVGGLISRPVPRIHCVKTMAAPAEIRRTFREHEK